MNLNQMNLKLMSRSIFLLSLGMMTACAPQGAVDPAASASAAACRSLSFLPDEFDLVNNQFNISIKFSDQTVTATEASNGCSRALSLAERDEILAKVRSISTCSTGSGTASNSLSARNATQTFGIDNPTASNVTINGGFNTFYSQIVALKDDVLSACATP
jgi:hypothetical protein